RKKRMPTLPTRESISEKSSRRTVSESLACKSLPWDKESSRRLPTKGAFPARAGIARIHDGFRGGATASALCSSPRRGVVFCGEEHWWWLLPVVTNLGICAASREKARAWGRSHPRERWSFLMEGTP